MSKHNFVQKHLGDDSTFNWRQGGSFNILCKEVCDNKNVSISLIRDWKRVYTVCGNNFPWIRDGSGQKRWLWVVSISFPMGTGNTGFDPALQVCKTCCSKSMWISGVHTFCLSQGDHLSNGRGNNVRFSFVECLVLPTEWRFFSLHGIVCIKCQCHWVNIGLLVA